MNPVITGIGIVAPNAVGMENFWQALITGKDAIAPLTLFPADEFSVSIAGEVKNFEPKKYLGEKGLRNIDRSALLLMVAAQEAIRQAKLTINDENADKFGICTGTTFSHFGPIIEFDKEVFTQGIDFSNPALFPSTVLNAPSSQVAIRFNIRGFNTTLTTGYASGLEALKYSINALKTEKAEIVLSAAVDSLTQPLFFGFHKLGYMTGIKGIALSCPFDKRRNGPVLAEGAAVLCMEDESSARRRDVPVLAKIRSVASFFDKYRIDKINPRGSGLQTAIKEALDKAGISLEDVDYISSCANSSADMDKIEIAVLKRIFGSRLKNIPVSSIKSMIGESFSSSANLQIASCIGAMLTGIVPPTINYKERDDGCDIDCVPNKVQKKEVKFALVSSFGPGGYNCACILEKCS